MTEYLVLDYETRSRADLPNVGAYEYARDPSTRILCVAGRRGKKHELRDAPIQVWSPAMPSPYGWLKRALLDPEVMLVAHNSYFEQVITKFVLTRLIHDPAIKHIPVERWICTMSMVLAQALPRSLDQSTQALGLSAQKDMVGHRLMKKMSRPRTPTKNDSSLWHCRRSDLERLMAYCVKDVEAETELFLTVPELSERERKIWVLDQKINWRGFAVDRPSVVRALTLIDAEKRALDDELSHLTQGKVSSARQASALKAFVLDQGYPLPDMQAPTIRDVLAGEKVPLEVRRVLEIRQAASLSSVAKYPALEQRSRQDGRVRDMLVHHAATTGRWGGQGVQPQNFPRCGAERALEIADGLADAELEDLRLWYDSPLHAMKDALRPMITAAPGNALFCADFSKIELCMLFWLARHEEGLLAIREGRDMYREQAADIYRRDVASVSDDQRYLGKKCILGGGYGMGHVKFRNTCMREDGVDPGLEMSERAISSYRTKHAPVVKLWHDVELAAKKAVRYPDRTFEAGRCVWFMDGRFLRCRLPSGRLISYPFPRLKQALNKFGKPVLELRYWTVNSQTRKWEETYTYGGRLTNNTTQGSARDVMADAMLRVEDEGYPIVATIHDEVVSDAPEWRDLDTFMSVMERVPPWADGCPIKVGGWKGFRYRKA